MLLKGDILGTTTLSNGQWYNIIINYETNNLSVFLNGSLEASDTSVTIDSHDGNFFSGVMFILLTQQMIGKEGLMNLQYGIKH